MNTATNSHLPTVELAEMTKSVREFYADFSAADLWKLPEIYAIDCEFKDPIHRVEGIEQLKSYMANMCANMNYCRFEFHRSACNGDYVTLGWTLYFSHPKLNGGNEVTLEGMSELWYDQGKIKKHVDHYDMGSMIYEQLPILRRLILYIKARMS